MLTEGLVDVRRRGRSRDAAAGLPQVVVGGYRPLGKQRPDPQRGGKQPVRRRIVRIGVHGRAKGLERVGVIEVVPAARPAMRSRFDSARASGDGCAATPERTLVPTSRVSKAVRILMKGYGVRRIGVVRITVRELPRCRREASAVLPSSARH